MGKTGLFGRENQLWYCTNINLSSTAPYIMKKGDDSFCQLIINLNMYRRGFSTNVDVQKRKKA